MTPDFICIGAAKSGTTWLYRVLQEHPKIHIGKKEIHFFNNKYVFYYHKKNLNYKKGLKWYFKELNAKKGTLSGEMTPIYLWDSKSAARIKKHFPEVKLLAILRDPLERAFSEFNYASKTLHFANDFKTGFKKYPEFKERSLYGKQLKKYYDLFDSKKIHIIKFEDLKNKPEEVYLNVCHFLNIKPGKPKNLHTKYNPTTIPKIVFVNKIFSYLQPFKKTKIGCWLWKYKLFTNLVDKIVWSISKLNTNKNKKNSLTTKELELKKEFHKDIRLLEKLTHKNFSNWK